MLDALWLLVYVHIVLLNQRATSKKTISFEICLVACFGCVNAKKLEARRLHTELSVYIDGIMVCN